MELNNSGDGEGGGDGSASIGGQKDAHVTAVQRELSRHRRKLGAVSPEAFAEVYLRQGFSLPPSKMHPDLFGLLHDATRTRGARIAIAAPRGHAKSSIVSEAYVLWCICYNLEPFILLVSSTAGQANDQLTIVKGQLTGNALLLNDFPDVCEPPGTKPGPPRWRQDDIITRNGVRVSAYGAGKQIRGRRQKHERPSLIILDDLEKDENANSQLQRDKLWDWLSKTVLKAGTPTTNVVCVGTLLHYDAVLARLLDPLKSPGWVGRKYKAVMSWATHQDLWERWGRIFNRDEQYEGGEGLEAAARYFEHNKDRMLEGTEVLWPERESYYQLMAMRLGEGLVSFSSEKQNDPIDPSTCVFREEDFRFWEEQFASEEALLASVPREHRRVYGACDPSMGKRGKHHDDSAIVTVLRDTRSNTLYVLDADVRRRTPDETIAAILEHHRRRRYNHFGIESNHFQEFMADNLRKASRLANLHVPLRKVVQNSDKQARIQSLQPKVACGLLRFSRRHRVLLEELRLFPKAAHDDGPDALEAAVALVTKAPFLGCL